MNELLLTNGNIFVSNDKFIVDNMLTDEDLDLELGPYVWNDLSSTDSNSSSLLTNNDIIDIDIDSFNNNGVNETNNLLNGLTPPETPPSSDRSSPPNFEELSSLIHSDHALRESMAQNTNISNVTLLPAIALCPSIITPLNPIITNQTSIIALNQQNECNYSINGFNNKVNTNHNTKDNKLQLSQLKREARKLRNREAASISRIKRKEYVDSLELKINCLIKENNEIKNENKILKLRVHDLEEDKKRFGKRDSDVSIETNCNCRSALNNGYSNKKATLSLLAVIFMLGLNLAPFSSILITNNKSISSVDSNLKQDFVKHGASRSLLWETNDKVPIDVRKAPEIHFNSSYNKPKDKNCNNYINQTESLRLENDLRGWLLRVNMEKEEVSKHKKRLIESNKLKNRYNKPIPLPIIKAWMQKRADQHLDDINEYSLESYTNGLIPQIKYEDLLSAIHRRDDTFYFFSFSIGDHLIIPPVSNGTDIRPRFSLIMPSVNTLNESSQQTNVSYHQIVMMQIDCEVINTKMVLLNGSPNSKTSDRKVSVGKNIKSKIVKGSSNPIIPKNKVQ